MKTYRKRLLTVRAVQWLADTALTVEHDAVGCYVTVGSGCKVYLDSGGAYIVIDLGRKVYLVKGDYLVPNDDGVSWHRVDEAVFEANYEEAG